MLASPHLPSQHKARPFPAGATHDFFSKGETLARGRPEGRARATITDHVLSLPGPATFQFGDRKPRKRNAGQHFLLLSCSLAGGWRHPPGVLGEAKSRGRREGTGAFACTGSFWMQLRRRHGRFLSVPRVGPTQAQLAWPGRPWLSGCHLACRRLVSGWAGTGPSGGLL